MTATLTTAAAAGTVTLTITEDGVSETHTVKDGPRVLGSIDRKLSDLMWNRSGFGPGMTATLTRPAVYTLLTKVNAA